MEKILKYKSAINDSCVFFSPNIPLERAQNAIERYAEGISTDDIVLLVDTSVMSSGKGGFLLTENHIYSKNLGNRAKSMPLQSIEKIKSANGAFSRSITLNKNLKMELQSLDKETVPILVEMFNAIISRTERPYHTDTESSSGTNVVSGSQAENPRIESGHSHRPLEPEIEKLSRGDIRVLESKAEIGEPDSDGDQSLSVELEIQNKGEARLLGTQLRTFVRDPIHDHVVAGTESYLDLQAEGEDTIQVHDSVYVKATDEYHNSDLHISGEMISCFGEYAEVANTKLPRSEPIGETDLEASYGDVRIEILNLNVKRKAVEEDSATYEVLLLVRNCSDKVLPLAILKIMDYDQNNEECNKALGFIENLYPGETRLLQEDMWIDSSPKDSVKHRLSINLGVSEEKRITTLENIPLNSEGNDNSEGVPLSELMGDDYNSKESEDPEKLGDFNDDTLTQQGDNMTEENKLNLATLPQPDVEHFIDNLGDQGHIWGLEKGQQSAEFGTGCVFAECLDRQVEKDTEEDGFYWTTLKVQLVFQCLDEDPVITARFLTRDSGGSFDQFEDWAYIHWSDGEGNDSPADNGYWEEIASDVTAPSWGDEDDD